MKQIQCLALSALISISFAACASAPYGAPEIDVARLPALPLTGLKVRKIALTVSNSRKVNHKAGNAAEVEKVVASAISDSLKRGGIQIEKSVNFLKVTILDCPETPEGVECVKFHGLLHTSRGKFELENFSSDAMQRSTNKRFAFGDVSRAYQNTLENFVINLEKLYEGKLQPSGESISEEVED